jgi:hypothetical protein
MSVGTKYATAFTNGSPISGFKNIGKIAIDTNPGSGDYSLGNFVGGVQASYDDNSYIIISDTTTALVDDRSTGNQTGTASPNQPTFFASKFKTDESFLRMVNRLPARSGQTPFTTGSDAKTWLNTNGYWTSYGSLVTSGLTLKLDAADANSYSGTGTTWYDLILPQQNITLVNSPSYTSGTPSYFTFNGTNQRGTGTGTGVVPQTAYTKSMWFYLNAYQDNNLVSSDIGGHFIFFGPGTGRIYCGHSNWGNYLAYPSASTYNLNTWYYIALTFNTTDGMKLYLNGTLDSTYTANKSAHTGDGSTNIGTFGGSNLLNGRIGKVYCYDRALTASEVLQNYNSDKAHFTPPLTITTNAGGGLDGFNVGGQAVAFQITSNPAIGTTYPIGSQITFQNGEVRTFVGYDDYGSVYDMFYDSPISTGTLFPITIE